MLALVGACMPNIPSQTMLPVIAKIVAGQAQQPRCGTARIFQQARAADHAVDDHCVARGVNLDSAFMSSVPAFFLASRCLRTRFGQRRRRPGTGDCAVSTDDFLNGYGPRNWHAPVCCKTIDFEERGKKGDADLSLSL
jgi:hypothetical protein